MKKNNEFARDKVVNHLIDNFPDLLAITDKPYSFVLPVKLEDGSISHVRLGITSCSQRFDESKAMKAKEYVALERQAREWVKQFSPDAEINISFT